MATNKKKVLDGHQVSIKSDSADQARLRLLQALWRERMDLPIGRQERPERDPVPLGSRVDDDEIRRQGINFLTPTVIERVEQTLAAADCAGVAQTGRLVSEQRLWSDLLSSQPLAFNLFGELAADLTLATAAARRLWGDQIASVTSICFEWSPGRGDSTYLDNHSSFDVFIAYTTATGTRGFVGIDVKYHENMRARAAKAVDWYEENPRYAAVAEASESFSPQALKAVADPAMRGARSSLGGTPMQQLWFDHLLALSMTQADDEWDHGKFVFMYPTANQRARNAADDYRHVLNDGSGFEPMTIEKFVAATAECTDAPWVEAFRQRYLDVGPVDALLGDADLKP